MGMTVMIWAARVSVASYLATVCVAASRSAKRPGRGECVLWSAGCAVLWTHIALAFAAAHHWSLAAAYEHTAQRTAAVTGWDWGGGLYVNFAVAVLWTVDAGWLWGRRNRGVAAPRWWTWGVHTALGFVILNATLVFGPRWWWWAAGVFAAVLGIACLVRARTHAE